MPVVSTDSLQSDQYWKETHYIGQKKGDKWKPRSLKHKCSCHKLTHLHEDAYYYDYKIQSTFLININQNIIKFISTRCLIANEQSKRF